MKKRKFVHARDFLFTTETFLLPTNTNTRQQKKVQTNAVYHSYSGASHVRDSGEFVSIIFGARSHNSRASAAVHRNRSIEFVREQRQNRQNTKQMVLHTKNIDLSA